MPNPSPASPSELRRVPGLYRRWELSEVLRPNRQYQIEDAGCTEDGTALVAVFEWPGDEPAEGTSDRSGQTPQVTARRETVPAQPE